MDSTTSDINVAKKRLETFTFGRPKATQGQGPPSPTETPTRQPRHHDRRRSANNSISLSLSQSVSAPTIMNMNNTPTTNNDFTPTTSRSRPSSHHRRRSSVSTRRESAEVMGVTFMSPSQSDPVLSADKDSIRRRALWALEGKPAALDKVEIPELTTPVAETTKKFDLHKPPVPVQSFGLGNTLVGKRDSFGKLLAASSSAQELLGTLVEEDEEEDEDVNQVEEDEDTFPIPSANFQSALTSSPKPTPRSRPNLRPLSLTPQSLTHPVLPTPSPTPSPRAGLRSLTLSPSPTPMTSSNVRRHEKSTDNRRAAGGLPYRNTNTNANSLASPPTPDTSSPAQSGFGAGGFRGHKPTTALDTGSVSSLGLDEQESRLSPSEQQFLYRSHATLLGRITELEKALRIERRTSSRLARNRPTSFTPSESESDISSGVSEGPSDEMLRLIADLKAERDDLTRDIDGWRVRTADLEKQLSVLTRRVDAERRDAWVAREKVAEVTRERDSLSSEITVLRVDLSRAEEIAQLLHEQFEKERSRVEELEAQLESSERRFSILSSTATEVEEALSPFSEHFPSKAKLDIVEEEEGDEQAQPDVPDDAFLDEDEEDEIDELARYEECMDSDESFVSGSPTSSMDSAYVRTTEHLQLAAATLSGSGTPTPRSSPPPPPPATVAGEIPSGWSFANSVRRVRQPAEVDVFFGCLEDLDVEEDDLPARPSTNPFARSAFVDDSFGDFVIPAQSTSQSLLDLVIEEEDEDEDEGQELTLPVFEDEEEVRSPIEIRITDHDDDIVCWRPETPSFTFEESGEADMTITAVTPPSSPPTINVTQYQTPSPRSKMSTPPRPITPTSIPQPKVTATTPPRSPSPRAFVTSTPRKASPSPTWTAARPSMIPQPSSMRGVISSTHDLPSTQQKTDRSSRSAETYSPPSSNLNKASRGFAASLSNMIGIVSTPVSSPAPRLRRYVSKERQLERLRKSLSSGDSYFGSLSLPAHCSKCDSEMVRL